MASYEKRYNELEWKYLSTYASNLNTVKLAYENTMEKLDTNVGDNFIETLAEGLESLSENDEMLLMQKVRDECFPMFCSQENKLMMLNNIQSSRTLLYIVQLWFNKLISIFKTLQINFEELKYFSENVRSRNQVKSDVWADIMQLVNSVYDCHLSEIRVSVLPSSAKSSHSNIYAFVIFNL